jgi:hypothetical protein
VFKAKDLRRLFDKDGYRFENLPFHFSDAGSARLAGPKSARVKYRPLICRRCNNESTSLADRAYDRFSDYLAASQDNGGAESLNLSQVFGNNWPEEMLLVRQYFAKSLGCRILASGALLPDFFPNPVSGDRMELLVISICRAQPFRSLPNYEESMFTTFLGKGDLYVNISKSHLHRTGESKVTSAVWWEHLGHFQICYWFGLQPNPQLGEPFDGSQMIYHIPAVNYDLQGMKELMAGWLSTADALYIGSDRLTYPMAQAAWAAYLSSRTSSAVTSTRDIEVAMRELKIAILEVKSAIDEEIRSYRTHADLDRVLSQSQRGATALLISAARIHGHLDGDDVALEYLSPELAEALERSYFASTWQEIYPVLREMYTTNVEHGHAPFQIDPKLLEAVLRFLDTLGLVVKSMPEGQCYVEIPFRRSNSTADVIEHDETL